MGEGLKALKNYMFDMPFEDYDTIEKELKDKEKFEELVNMDLDLFMKAVDIKGLVKDYPKFKKAIEIIKNKNIDLLSLKHAFIMDKEGEESGLDWYNSAMLVRRKVLDTFTQEEYGSLKEVMLWQD